MTYQSQIIEAGTAIGTEPNWNGIEPESVARMRLQNRFRTGLDIARYTAKIMRQHLADDTRPREENPSYPPDRINDRWPRPDAAGLADMKALAEALEHLAARLEFMARASLTDIANTIDELFGERIGREQRAILMERYDRRDWAAPVLSAARTGGIYAPAVVAAPERLREVPRHNFHPFILGAPADGPDED